MLESIAWLLGLCLAFYLSAAAVLIISVIVLLILIMSDKC